MQQKKLEEDLLKDKEYKTIMMKRDILSMPRKSAVALFRMEVGHNCLADHLYKIHCLPSPKCTFCMEDEILSLENNNNSSMSQKLGKTATDTFQMMQQVYGDNALNCSVVFRWHRLFHKGETVWRIMCILVGHKQFKLNARLKGWSVGACQFLPIDRPSSSGSRG